MGRNNPSNEFLCFFPLTICNPWFNVFLRSLMSGMEG
jgi:hypothetical protein